MSERRTIFFKDIDINDVVYVIGQEKRSSPQQHDRRLVITGAEAERNSQGFHRAMCSGRIFAYDYGNPLGHLVPRLTVLRECEETITAVDDTRQHDEAG